MTKRHLPNILRKTDITNTVTEGTSKIMYDNFQVLYVNLNEMLSFIIY
jgi:hypothetical protein